LSPRNLRRGLAVGPAGEPGGPECEERERERIKNRLMLWGAFILIGLLGFLVIFDVWDDTWGPCKYQIPGWLITLVTGIFGALFAKAGLDLFKNGRK
jgi:hypothetical protein